MEMIDISTTIVLGLTLILAFIGGEVKAFRVSYIALSLYGFLIGIALSFHSLLVGLAAILVVSVITPLFIRWLLIKTKTSAEPPIEGIMGKAPFALIASILTMLLLYDIGVKLMDLVIGTALAAYGLTLLVSKNNLIKFILGIVYMHTGISLFTSILYPASFLTSLFEASCYIILLIFVSLFTYFTATFYSKSRTILSRDLTKLRW
ncbi:MAG: hypothetical protein QXJ86_03515 [Nitrososphaerales archaeon]